MVVVTTRARPVPTNFLSKEKVEEYILSHLKDQLLSVENLKYIYDNVEKEVLKSLNELPEELKQKRQQQKKIQTELQNLLNFMNAGNFSKAVSEAITDAEGPTQKIDDEIQGLKFQRKSTFKSPPKEWIEDRLDNLQETLEKGTKLAAMGLRCLLGCIKIDSVAVECVIEDG